MQGINAVLKSYQSKNEAPTLSKAVRSASKTFLIEYEHGGVKYEAVMPAERRKKLAWTHCIAHYKDNSTKDVTEAARYRAGPMADFNGLADRLKPTQVVTSSVYLEFINGDKIVMTIGEKAKLISEQKVEEVD